MAEAGKYIITDGMKVRLSSQASFAPRSRQASEASKLYLASQIKLGKAAGTCTHVWRWQTRRNTQPQDKSCSDARHSGARVVSGVSISFLSLSLSLASFLPFGTLPPPPIKTLSLCLTHLVGKMPPRKKSTPGTLGEKRGGSSS